MQVVLDVDDVDVHVDGMHVALTHDAAAASELSASGAAGAAAGAVAEAACAVASVEAVASQPAEADGDAE